MEKETFKKYKTFLKHLGQLLSLARLYHAAHPVVKSKTQEVFSEISALLTQAPSLVLSELGEMFLVNDQEMKLDDRLVDRLAQDFHLLGIGSLSFEKGLTIEELSALVDLLCAAKRFQGEAEVKKYLSEKSVKHLLPHFASYKLVKETERIVKEGEMLRLEDIPAAVRDQFLKDLQSGRVSAQSKARGEDKIYPFLAHDPGFLSEQAFEKTREKPEDISQVLWAIGAYLMEEVTTARLEEMNRKILGEFEDRLLALWAKKTGEKGSAQPKDEIEKTCAAINAALQTKGLILLYQKHKKGMESAAKKLQRILESLPPDSVLYQRTKKDLEKIGVLKGSGI